LADGSGRSGIALSSENEYVIDGEEVNRLLESYQLGPRILPGQVFEIIEKKFIKNLADEIEKAKSQTVRFVNVEAIQSGPHKDFVYAICGGLVELIDSLVSKKVAVTGTIRDPRVIPWSLVSRIDKQFKGLVGIIS